MNISIPWPRWNSYHGTLKTGDEISPAETKSEPDVSDHEPTSPARLEEQPSSLGGDNIAFEIHDAVNGQISGNSVLEVRDTGRTKTLSPGPTLVALGEDLNRTEKYEKSRARYEILKRLDELDSQRMRVLTLREHCRQQRTNLGAQRRSIERLDQDVLKQLYLWHTNPNTAHYDGFVRALEPLILARENLQTSSEMYQQLENDLNRKEWELKENEATFYRRIVPMQTEALSTYGSESIKDEDPMSEIFMGNPSWEGLSPVVRDLTERLAARRSDAQQVEDQLVELRDEERELRLQAQQSHQPLDTDASNFLNAFDQKYSELEEELRQLLEDIFVLQDRINDHNDILFRNSKFDQDPDFDEASAEAGGEPVSIVLEPPPEVSSEIPAGRRDSENWEMVDSIDQDSSPNGLSWSFKVTYFVNLWLGHLLKGSRTQVMICSASGGNIGLSAEPADDPGLSHQRGGLIVPNSLEPGMRNWPLNRRRSAPTRFLYPRKRSLPTSDSQSMLTTRDALSKDSVWAQDNDTNGGFLSCY